MRKNMIRMYGCVMALVVTGSVDASSTRQPSRRRFHMLPPLHSQLSLRLAEWLV